jgi:dienelactone hydrolase
MIRRSWRHTISFRSDVVLAITSVLLAALAFTGVAMAENPVPLINQPLIPDATRPGGLGFTLSVNGTGFVSSSVVNWNGVARNTTFVSRSQLQANILASDIAQAGTASVTVFNSAPGGGTSNIIFFEVTPASSTLRFGVASEISTGTQADGVAIGDFNRDGKLDLAVANIGSNNVSILLGNGDGTFQPPVNYSVGAAPYTVAVGDLNGDGKPDLAVSNDNGPSISILLGNGDGTFQPVVDYPVGSGANSVTIADLNADGKLDLISSNWGSQNVSVLLGNGDGTLQPAVNYPTGGATDGQAAIGDFNGDGKVDFAVTAGNLVCVFFGNGDGTFQPAVCYGGVSGTRGVRAGDFNGDGKLDLVVANVLSNDVSVLFGNGDGTFQPAVHYAAGPGPNWLEIGDFNGDGKLDVVVADAYAHTVSVLLGKGDGTFQPAASYVAGSTAGSVAFGDFNGDGRLDFAVGDGNSGAVAVLLQVTTVTLSPPSLTFADQVIGTRSPFQLVTLTNGSLTLTINSIAVTGIDPNDFIQTNNCGSSLPPGARCTIVVSFTPTQIGPRNASITITDSGWGNPQSVALSGTGVASGPNATLSPTSLTFATQLVGTTSPAQLVTLNNYGTATLTINSINFTGADPNDFVQTNTCGGSVGPGGSCTISVTFKPTQLGSRTATLAVTDNAPGSPQTVSVTGIGTVVKLNPTSLSFDCGYGHGNCPPPPQTTTLTNTGSTPLTINSITITGQFSETNNCPPTLEANQFCTITVSFQPPGYGTFHGAVSVSDNGGGSPQQVALTGTKYRKRGMSLGELTTLSTIQKASAPSPSGPSNVGTRIVQMVDSLRDDPFAADGSKRALLVRLWYPTPHNENCQPAPYTSPAVWSYFSQLAGLLAPEVRTNSCLDAPVSEGRHPVVVFTHGYTGTFTDYTYLFEDLASRGYLVAAVDHTYEATAVEFPDGRFVESVFGSHLAEKTWRRDEQSLSLAVSVRLKDLRFIVDELVRLNGEPGSPFAGRLDLDKVALAGHSLGALTALLSVQQEARFKAGVLLDPTLSVGSASMTETPVLVLAMGREQWSDEECRLWSDLQGPRFAVNLKGAEHVTPSDAVWLAKGAIKTGTMGPEKTIEALRDYVAAFLDVSLRGKPAGRLLTGSSLDYPDAVVTRKEQSLCRQP